MNDDMVLKMILHRLDRLEAKVDKLIAFRAWLLGLGAAAGAIGGQIFFWFKGFR